MCQHYCFSSICNFIFHITWQTQDFELCWWYYALCSKYAFHILQSQSTHIAQWLNLFCFYRNPVIHLENLWKLKRSLLELWIQLSVDNILPADERMEWDCLSNTDCWLWMVMLLDRSDWDWDCWPTGSSLSEMIISRVEQWTWHTFKNRIIIRPFLS